MEKNYHVGVRHEIASPKEQAAFGCRTSIDLPRGGEISVITQSLFSVFEVITNF